ncbi:hypothetical protein vseg_021176 [Gypsophila vaccaria]
MADNADQTRAEDAPHTQQNSLRISISPHLRQKVIAKIINTLSSRCTDPGTLPKVETIARKFEDKVLAVASDEHDYLRRIASRMQPLEGCSRRAADSSIPSAASSDPNQFHSGNVQLTDIKHDQQLVESKDPSRLQSSQITNSNSPSFATLTPAIHASRSHPTSPYSDLLNISKTPPAFEKEDPVPVPVQLPYSQKAVGEQFEVSSSYRRQLVTKQQYESWQRDLAHQRKGILIPSQHKSPTFSRQHETIQPQRSMAQSSGHNEELKQQTVKPHDLHSMPKGQSSGEWQVSTGFISSQEERLRVQRMSQKKPEVVGEEKTSSYGVKSVSQDQPRPGIGILQLKSVPLETTKRSDTSSAVERHGDAQAWRENIYQRITAMKKMYQPGLAAMDAQLDDRLKLLNTHPNDPTKDEILTKLKGAKVMVGRMLCLLNIPKEEIMPVHGERMDNWEQVIVSYLRLFFKPNIALPPQIHSAAVQPSEETVAGASLPPTPTNAGDNSQTHAHDRRNSDVSPLERLLKAVNSISPQALKSAMDDVFSVTSMADMIESSEPMSTAKGTIGHDLGAITGCPLQARNTTKTWTARPWLTDNRLTKRLRSEPPLKLLSEEIRNLKQRLIDIDVQMYNTYSETVVKCYYTGVSVDSTFIKSIYPSSSTLIQPLEMLVPRDYPESPPILLGKLPTSRSVNFGEDLSDEARARLDLSLRSLHSPLSVSDIAQTWELCARAVVIECAHKFGGGTFSSRYGNWDQCLCSASAA